MKVIPKSLLVAAGVSLLAVGVMAHAQPGDKPLERARKIEGLRASVMHLQGWSAGPMGAMLKGQIPYDAKAFNTRAKRLVALAGMVEEVFKEDIRSFDVDTAAKPKIWDDYADFSKLAGNLVGSTTKLAEISAAGDIEASRKAFVAVADDCKACHDKYQVEDDD